MARSGFDQKTLAEKAEVPRSSLSEFIRGARGLRQGSIDKLSEVTGIAAEVLVLWRLRVMQGETRTKRNRRAHSAA